MRTQQRRDMMRRHNDKYLPEDISTIEFWAGSKRYNGRNELYGKMNVRWLQRIPGAARPSQTKVDGFCCLVHMKQWIQEYLVRPRNHGSVKVIRPAIATYCKGPSGY